MGKKQDHDELDKLGRKMDGLIIEFEPWRHQARNSLWLSVGFIMAAGLGQTAHVHHGFDLTSITVAAILIAGMISIPITVHKFRHAFRPLLKVRGPRRSAVPSTMHENVGGVP